MIIFMLILQYTLLLYIQILQSLLRYVIMMTAYINVDSLVTVHTEFIAICHNNDCLIVYVVQCLNKLDARMA